MALKAAFQKAVEKSERDVDLVDKHQQPEIKHVNTEPSMVQIYEIVTRLSQSVDTLLELAASSQKSQEYLDPVSDAKHQEEDKKAKHSNKVKMPYSPTLINKLDVKVSVKRLKVLHDVASNILPQLHRDYWECGDAVCSSCPHGGEKQQMKCLKYYKKAYVKCLKTYKTRIIRTFKKEK